MNEAQFERIATMTDLGREYMLHTMEHFGSRLMDHEKKAIIESVLTLIRSERIDAAVKAVETRNEGMI